MGKYLRVELKKIHNDADGFVSSYQKYLRDVENFNHEHAAIESNRLEALKQYKDGKYVLKKGETLERVEQPDNPHLKSRTANWWNYRKERMRAWWNKGKIDYSKMTYSTEEAQWAKGEIKYDSFTDGFKDTINQHATSYGMNLKDYKDAIKKSEKVKEEEEKARDKQKREEHDKEIKERKEAAKKQEARQKKLDSLNEADKQKFLQAEQEKEENERLAKLEKENQERQARLDAKQKEKNRVLQQKQYHEQEQGDYKEASFSDWLNTEYSRIHSLYRNSQVIDPLMEDNRAAVQSEDKKLSKAMLALYKAALEINSQRSIGSFLFNWKKDYQNSKAIGVIERSLMEDFGFTKQGLKEMRKFLTSTKKEKWSNIISLDEEGNKEKDTRENHLEKAKKQEKGSDLFGNKYTYKNEKELDEDSLALYADLEEQTSDKIEAEKEQFVTYKQHKKNIEKENIKEEKNNKIY